MGNDNNNGVNVNPVQVQKYLGGIDYPVNKQELIQTAKDNGADENVLSMLERLEQEEFESPTDVASAMS